MPNRRQFVTQTALATAALGLAGRRGRAQGRLPNIVLVFTDDQGYADLGCYGASGFQTPQIDSLARDGLRFSSFYVAQAVCSASRTGLLTGCFPNRIGILGALNHTARHGIGDREVTLGQLLQSVGYATGIFGKWHLGHHRQFLPLQHGFDEYLGLPYSNDMWPVRDDGTAAPPSDKGKGSYPPLPLYDGNEVVATITDPAGQDSLTTRYTERAVAFIERHRQRPFFCYVPHSMPHVPLGVSAKFRGSSQQGRYGDVIQEIDWSVGQILSTLDRLDLRDNTLVIFTSDNGPWRNYGNHAGSPGPLREGKGCMWEGGCRVPCVVRWPGVIAAGRETDQIAATVDLLPTFAAITGAALPEHPIDGLNLLPLLRNEPGAVPRSEYFYYYGETLCAVRRGSWKLTFPHAYRSYAGVNPGRDGLAGPYAQGQVGYELYHLETDLGEQRDVAAQHPALVTELRALGEQQRALLTAGKRPPGRLPAA
ncbi:MAG: sulfatase [Fimbriimonadaceae bacterium]|nr:sulfatase [Fimbriimonadaceae bacterium]